MAFLRNTSSEDSTYTGETYHPSMDEQDFQNLRTREKGYSMIAAILHVLIGLLPAMALSFAPVAVCYILGLLLVIRMTLRYYRAPSEAVPLSRPQYLRFVVNPGRMCNAVRILAFLTLILNIIFTFRYQIGIGPWFIVQIVLLLLEALALQFLFRLQRGVQWDAETP